jgi:hypothetical protein
MSLPLVNSFDSVVESNWPRMAASRGAAKPDPQVVPKAAKAKRRPVHLCLPKNPSAL